MIVYDTIIIGAGAAGLIASSTLTSANKRVLLLEARDRIGGRIYTINNTNFSTHIEAGAEFVHGEMPITLSVLNELRIPLHEIEGHVYQVRNGNKDESNLFDDGWQEVIDKLFELKDDIVFEEFLNRYFPGKQQVRNNISKFVEGYNAADTRKVSSFSLRDEWSHEDEPKQNRPETGYRPVMEFLLETAKAQGAKVHLKTIVSKVDWSEEIIRVKTANGEVHSGKTVLVTVPIGVLQSGDITFNPAVLRYLEASKNIGVGPVVKFVVEFQKMFWNDVIENRFPKAKFIFSDAEIPTWWSQLPQSFPILTGWLAGPNVNRSHSDASNFETMAIRSLCYLLNTGEQLIREAIAAIHIEDWNSDPLARGAYSYDMISSKEAKDVLNTPINNKIFFAGEGVYSGPFTGTVEGALQSGTEASKKILDVLKM